MVTLDPVGDCMSAGDLLVQCDLVRLYALGLLHEHVLSSLKVDVNMGGSFQVASPF